MEDEWQSIDGVVIRESIKPITSNLTDTVCLKIQLRFFFLSIFNNKFEFQLWKRKHRKPGKKSLCKQHKTVACAQSVRKKNFTLEWEWMSSQKKHAVLLLICIYSFLLDIGFSVRRFHYKLRWVQINFYLAGQYRLSVYFSHKLSMRRMRAKKKHTKELQSQQKQICCFFSHFITVFVRCTLVGDFWVVSRIFCLYNIQNSTQCTTHTRYERQLGTSISQYLHRY